MSSFQPADSVQVSTGVDRHVTEVDCYGSKASDPITCRVLRVSFQKDSFGSQTSRPGWIGSSWNILLGEWLFWETPGEHRSRRKVRAGEVSCNYIQANGFICRHYLLPLHRLPQPMLSEPSPLEATS